MKDSKMNVKLKVAILSRGLRQYALATELGMSETRMSRIISGRLDPTPDERRRFSKFLGISERELFSG